MKSIQIVAGSVYGAALDVAAALKRLLTEAGFDCTLHERSALNVVRVPESLLLVVSSTTGSGDVPDSLQPLLAGLINEPPMLVGYPFAVVALGDSSYGDTYCGGGRQLQAALLDIAATEIAPMLTIDAMMTSEPVDEAQQWLQSNLAAFRRAAGE
ncbi:flavodoxin domain-containing protein [Allohahella sp. A8]|uniref:flavodoxin domain-containing protein n=1 Tax=Allohahella sp. A8 TaxID=3141461 RepID=UPI003A806686